MARKEVFDSKRRCMRRYFWATTTIIIASLSITFRLGRRLIYGAAKFKNVLFIRVYDKRYSGSRKTNRNSMRNFFIAARNRLRIGFYFSIVIHYTSRKQKLFTESR